MTCKNILPTTLLIAVVTIVFSCTNNLEELNQATEALEFTATTQPFESGTKTVLTTNDRVEWENGDLISVNGSIFRAYINSDDHTKATFGYVSGPSTTAPFNAYYPAAIYGESGPAALLATQTWTEGKISNVPMFATTESQYTNFNFKNICALFELTVIGDDVKKVRKIEVSTTDKALWGPIVIENGVASITGTGLTAANDTLILDCGEDGALLKSQANGGTKFWIALPAGTYDNLSFKVYGDQDAQYLKMSLTSQQSFLANHIYTLDLTSNDIKTRRSVTVTNSSPTRGTVSVDNTTDVKEGTTVTITISADPGYPVPDISVVDGNGLAVTLSGTGNERTFVMPASDVTVTSNFYPVPNPDLMNVSFNLNGTAMDLSDSKIRFVPSGAPSVIDRGEAFSQCSFASNASWGGNGTNYFSFIYEDYQPYKTFYNGLLDGFSVECWVMGHPDAAGTEAVAVGSFEKGGFGIESVGNKLCFTVYTDDAYRYADSNVQISDGVYYHVVGVYSKSRGKAEIYVDGVLSGSEDAPGNFRPPIKDGKCKFSIGGTRNSAYADTYSGNGWNGDIVFVRMYDTPLSAAHAAYLHEHKNDKPATQGSFDGHDWVQLWKGGTRWATTNVGAAGPEYDGNFYAWGETEPKSKYWWDTYEYAAEWFAVDEPKFTKYVTNSKYGVVDDRSSLTRSDDVASQNWGGSTYSFGRWRIPSATDWYDLEHNCTWEAYELSDVRKGLKVTGPNGNHIILPAAGYYEEYTWYGCAEAHYWSSNLYLENNSIAWEALFYMQKQEPYEVVTKSFRCHGLPIRPVFY